MWIVTQIVTSDLNDKVGHTAVIKYAFDFETK